MFSNNFLVDILHVNFFAFSEIWIKSNVFNLTFRETTYVNKSKEKITVLSIKTYKNLKYSEGLTDFSNRTTSQLDTMIRLYFYL